MKGECLMLLVITIYRLSSIDFDSISSLILHHLSSFSSTYFHAYRWDDLLAESKKPPLSFLLLPYLGYGSAKGLADVLGKTPAQVQITSM